MMGIGRAAFARVWLLCAIAVALAAYAAPVEAAEEEQIMQNGRAQAEGRAHNGPRAYHAMCARAPGLCMHDRLAGRRPGTGPVARLTPGRRSELEAVNGAVNARVRPIDDLTLYGQSDFWTAAVESGDCEDYIIAKKQALIAAGWAADQLLYAVVEGRQTRYHAVLVVRTDRGDLVLDNLAPGIRRWEETGYVFVIRQSAADPYSWVRVVADGGAQADAGGARLGTR